MFEISTMNLCGEKEKSRYQIIVDSLLNNQIILELGTLVNGNLNVFFILLIM